MAKNKKEEKINILNPKVGKIYSFQFAGSSLTGPIVSIHESLTKKYGYAWFWMTSSTEVDEYRYPVSIYNIFKEIKDV